MGHELRFRDGVPIYDGTAELFERYRREALLFAETLEWRKRQTAAPRLIAALEGAARVAAQQRPSAWFSHPKGVEDLLDHLKATMKAPTLPDAGRHISRFFYGLKRRKGESMAAWLVRHDEALDDVRRTLSEAIREYGPKTMAAPTATTTPLRATTPSGASRLSGDIYDEAGRLVEDQEETDEWDAWEPAPWDQWGWWSQDHGWHQDRRTNRESSTRHSMEMGSWAADREDPATVEASQFLPDFVLAWMLLQRSGLDHQEKGSLIANLKNEFTMAKVKEILRLNWPDDELKRRDTSRGAALLATGMEEDDEVYAATADDEDLHDALLTDENAAEYQALEAEAQEAYQALQQQRNTLRQAREKQHAMRQNRRFFGNSRGPPASSRPTAATPGMAPKCLKCGGKHWTRQCGQGNEGTKTGSANLVFMMESESAMATSTVETALATGKAIVDGGAASSVGSIQAVEKIRELAWQKFGTDPIEVIPDQAPSFRFGNNGRVQCSSTTCVSVPLDGGQGGMHVAVHELPGQPVLMSIKSLRALGAVIDYDRDEMILKKVNSKKVVKLERADSGHQLFPMVTDIYQGGAAQ